MKDLFKVKFNVLSLVLIAMFMAITIILSFFNQFLPKLPYDGTISIDIIAIFLCAYFMGTGYGIICGIGVAILQFALGMATYYGPWSVLLDYIIPLALCGLAPLIKTTRIKNIPIFWGIIFSMILKFISHYISGVWLFGVHAPYNPWLYSLVYNLIYNVPTLILCMIVTPILYERLKPAFRGIYR